MIIDITRPHVGRIYDYMLGGTQNYEADRSSPPARLSATPMPGLPRRGSPRFAENPGKTSSAHPVL